MYKTTLTVCILVVLVSFLLLILLPEVSILILSLNLVLTIFLGYKKISLVRFFTKNDQVDRPAPLDQPFVSIHIAVCNEPVNSVIKTIKAAIRQDYDNYEVILLYNNTTSAKLWIPIKAFCEFIPRVTFYNYSKIEGYKAGALNICRELMNPGTTYIFTLDADYILKPNALTTAVQEVILQDVDLLQFPQSYTNHRTSNALATEFKHYFDLYAASAGRLNMNLPTGTLSLVNIDCLNAIGGWPTTSITEDAFLGVELLQNKCSIGYCDKIIGQGIMPSSTADLKSQRMRWIFGNFQTLVHTLSSKKFGVHSKGIIATQLTSWLNLNGLAWIHMLLVGLLSSFYRFDLAATITWLALAIVLVHAATQIILFARGYKSISRAVSCYVIHMANSFEGAYAWWGYFINRERPFARTSKFDKEIGFDLEQCAFNAILFLSGCLLFINTYLLLGSIVMLYAALRMLSRIYLYINLVDARKNLNKVTTT